MSNQPLTATPESTITDQPPRVTDHESPNTKKYSFHHLHTTLRDASSSLDEILKDLDLSKEETEELLASAKYQSHRQLRTQLLAQQLQIIAQDHARAAIATLVQLTSAKNPGTARLAAAQLLAYAGLTPPPPPPPLQLIPQPPISPPDPAPPQPQKPRDCNPCGSEAPPPSAPPLFKFPRPQSAIP
ncbi:MAG TPA: hypothetical protein VM008_00795, partial [Phycisphaerae bacterium]|nr:hypothetical protein [Phycisphaerae bacterium]